ncbi:MULTISPECIES: helix-turn-helix domain-containing protein [Magnetospirillum]|uniref:helix-turn-helix domain-containing protein n=1 Tax=Magnetospirillum TaxID=13134 RepID=UPI0009EF4B5B|nr:MULTISPECIES: helix-turn-helix domain-containing protein [Magnetospirillum]MBF0326092.1 helix-turn-helix domain-containing protein [Alphaproteobacteria bacterium]CAA7619330.1 Nitrogen fixation regulation protein FixK [Magnetospirillum sp. LM-5]
MPPPLDFEDHKAEREIDLARPSCRNCDVVREIAFCADLSSDEIKRLASVRCHAELPAAFTVFREGDVADHVYSISGGAVKLYKLLSDGRRQIIGFLFSGDLFGLGLDGGYAYTAETLTQTQLCRFTHRKLDSLRGEIPMLERRLFTMTVKDLVAAHDQMLLLGRKTAREKVASFLDTLSRRAVERGLAASPVDLPMSRADIADYLGLTIETVSRTFTQLKRDGIIGLPASGHVVLQDTKRLKETAEGGPTG